MKRRRARRQFSKASCRSKRSSPSSPRAPWTARFAPMTSARMCIGAIFWRQLSPRRRSARPAPRGRSRSRRLIADASDYVGVLAVEMFLVAEGGERVVVNEIAPRVHNSGHWTLDGAVTSQFEQHVRAIAGWPLGSTRRHGRCVMRILSAKTPSSGATCSAKTAPACIFTAKAKSVRAARWGM